MNRLFPHINHNESPEGPAVGRMIVVGRACLKDREAFAEIYEYYKEPIAKRLRYLVGDEQAVPDLLQDTFVRAWQSISLEVGSRFESWLHTIARNLAVDYLRHKGRLQFVSLHRDEPDEPGSYQLSAFLSVPGHEDQVCDLLCLSQALAAMSPQYRVCLLLQVDWGLTQAEIGTELGITTKAVSTNVSRGHKQLRRIYTEMMDDDHVMHPGGSKRNGKINFRSF